MAPGMPAALRSSFLGGLPMPMDGLMLKVGCMPLGMVKVTFWKEPRDWDIFGAMDSMVFRYGPLLAMVDLGGIWNTRCMGCAS
eukprot:scaffold3499_cov247-Pinguiococcus_pyrenoidosus.AAC.9